MEVSNEIVETFWDSGISWYDKITASQTLRNCKRRHFNWEKHVSFCIDLKKQRKGEI